MRKRNDRLTPAEVKAMGLKEFERRFGFRPRDAHEKHFFAAVARRPTSLEREAIAVGIVGEIDVSSVNMGE